VEQLSQTILLVSCFLPSGQCWTWHKQRVKCLRYNARQSLRCRLVCKEGIRHIMRTATACAMNPAAYVLTLLASFNT
jgi:hypothetical protein